MFYKSSVNSIIFRFVTILRFEIIMHMRYNRIMDENRRKTPFNKTIMFLIKLAVFCMPVWFFYALLMPEGGGQIVWASIYALVLGLLSKSFGCYQIGVYRLRTLLFSYCAALFFTNLVTALQIWLIYDVLRIWWFMLLWMLQSLVSAVIYMLANAIYFLISPPRRLLAVCRGTHPEINMVQRFAENRQRFVLSEIISPTMGEAAIKAAIDKVPAVLLGDIDKRLRDNLTSYCFENNKRLLVVPNLQDVMMHEAHLTQFGDTMVFMCKNRGMTQEQAITKRIVDILLSAFGLIVVSPIMLITAVLIKLTSKGPIFYRQTRVTKDGREFTLFKFRSMVNDAEKDGKAVLACEGDARITPVGRVIRRVRIDELPQLWNILKGDMSVVGPRPERPEIMKEYMDSIPAFRYRLKVKAGLTGYAQVFGRYNTPFEEKVKMDVYYISRYSLFLDLQLILSTVRILFMKDSTQGVVEVEPPPSKCQCPQRRRGFTNPRIKTAARPKPPHGTVIYPIVDRRSSAGRKRQRAFLDGMNSAYRKGDADKAVE